MPIDDRDLVNADLYRFLRREAGRGAQYDGVILDPPPHVPRRGARGPVGQDYPALVPLVLPLLSDGAWLLGFCSKSDIRKVVTRRSGSFRFCYEKELQLQPDLAGKVTVRFTIGRDGTVPKAKIASSTIRQRKVEQCVLKVFRGMRFTKPEGGICVVNWPLTFR